MERFKISACKVPCRSIYAPRTFSTFSQVTSINFLAFLCQRLLFNKRLFLSYHPESGSGNRVNVENCILKTSQTGMKV